MKYLLDTTKVSKLIMEGARRLSDKDNVQIISHNDGFTPVKVQINNTLIACYVNDFCEYHEIHDQEDVPISLESVAGWGYNDNPSKLTDEHLKTCVTDIQLLLDEASKTIETNIQLIIKEK